MTGTRFVIVADLRTGSTLLSTSLNRHPEVLCYGELLHEHDFDDNCPEGCDRAALDSAGLLAAAFTSGDPRAIGFRAMVAHPPPSRPQWREVWEQLHAIPELRVVYLHRRDRLAQYTSLQVAAASGVFHPSAQTPELSPEQRPRIHIDPDAFTAWVADRQTRELARLRILADKQLMAVSYERLTGCWQQTLRRIQGFLRVPVLDLPMAKHKQETRPLSQAIANYDELLRRGLAGGSHG